MRELIISILKALVDVPDKVQVTQIEGQNLTYEIQADRSDLGKIIGRNGRTIISLRNLCSAIAGTKKLGFITLDLIEDETDKDKR